jgi:twitching motility protein PilT
MVNSNRQGQSVPPPPSVNPTPPTSKRRPPEDVNEENTEVIGAIPQKSAPPQNNQMRMRKAPAQSPPPPPPPANSREYTPSRKVPQPSPGNPILEEIVKYANDKGYSDIHLGVGEIPRYRDRGEMIITEYPKTDRNTFMSWLHEVLTDQEIQKFEKELEFDGATQYEFARVRINIFDSLLGPALVMRIIPNNILTMDQLKLPPVFRDVSNAHKGLILITGPTGSGKSTTMAAMVDYINREHPKHIITIEDPIEFVHQSRKSMIRQREVGQHTLKFDNALKAALREDPDLILVGEMRDRTVL